jgi:hypothetical protein
MQAPRRGNLQKNVRDAAPSSHRSCGRGSRRSGPRVPSSSRARTVRPVVASTKDGSLTVADVDGDGKLDFAIQALDTMYVLGNGDGTFALPVAKWQNSAFALGDLDGDADLDVVQRSAYTQSLEGWLKGVATTYTKVGSTTPPSNFVARGIASPTRTATATPTSPPPGTSSPWI